MITDHIRHAIVRPLLALVLSSSMLLGCQEAHQRQAQAPPQQQQQQPQQRAPFYLSANAVDVLALLPGPPRAGSEQDQGDLQCVLDAQASRTNEQIERAHSEENLTVFAFADVLGPQFTAEHCPKAAKLFEQVKIDSRVFSGRAKSNWKRLRPYQSDTRVHHAALNPETDFSHPSGHATRGVLMAELLAEIFPEHRAALLDRGRQIGWDRVILGMHYPTDIYAGQTLGHALAPKFLGSPKFQSDLAPAAKEMRAAVPTSQRLAATH